MRIIAAYLLAVLGGCSSPDQDKIAKIMGSVGVEADPKEVQSLVQELQVNSIPSADIKPEDRPLECVFRLYFDSLELDFERKRS